jgi:hypothetical protein
MWANDRPDNIFNTIPVICVSLIGESGQQATLLIFKYTLTPIVDITFIFYNFFCDFLHFSPKISAFAIDKYQQCVIIILRSRRKGKDDGSKHTAHRKKH